jgi:hypothetical protein
MSVFQLQCLGIMMEPEPSKPLEVEGILDPAAAERNFENSTVKGYIL